VQAWLNNAPLVDVDTHGRHLSLRPELAPSRPLGVATYATEAAVRAIAWRPVTVQDRSESHRSGSSAPPPAAVRHTPR
jgi:hypothetical protein